MTDNKDIKDKVSSTNEEDKFTLEIEIDLDGTNEIPEISQPIEDLSVSMDLEIDSVIGQWQVKELMAQNATSFVYRVQGLDNLNHVDDKTPQQAALKIISQKFSNNDLVDRFLLERQVFSDFDHPNIAKIYDAGVTSHGLPWFTMEYIFGDNLLIFADHEQYGFKQRVVLFKQVCAALDYSHSQGIVHQNIKPNNLRVDENKTVKLLDFGMLSVDDRSASLIANPSYMSPEQAMEGAQEIDSLSDVFSLGVLLYKLISSEVPFEAENTSKIRHKIIHDKPNRLDESIPPELQAITFKCLEKKPENRYSSVNKLLLDLDAYLNGETISVKDIRWASRLKNKIKQYPIIGRYILASFLVIVFFAAYAIYHSIESLQTKLMTEKYLAITQDLKAKIRLTHVLPLHNIQQEYDKFEENIKALNNEIKSNKVNTGVRYFALGSVYLAMRNTDKAKEYFLQALNKGWESPELYSGLAYCFALDWEKAKIQALTKRGDYKELFVTKTRKEFYQPAIKYLKLAQVGLPDDNLLSARIAFINEDYDKALEEIEKEIGLNPWHYEAISLASEIYLLQFYSIRQKQGDDKAIQYLDLSNEKLQASINIGRSDSYHYLPRCHNAGIGIEIKILLGLDDEVLESYKKGAKYCQAALVLEPDARSPWINLNLLSNHKAKYLEAKGLSSLETYQATLTLFENGLAVNPDDFQLRIDKVLTLLEIAKQTIKQQNDPREIFSQALDSVKLAIETNPESSDSWLQLANVQKEYANYFRMIRADLHHAESFYLQAIESFQQKNTLEYSLLTQIEIGNIQYNLALIKWLQGKRQVAIDLMSQSIQTRIDIIPIQQRYFSEILNVLDNYHKLLQLKQENKQTYIEELNRTFELLKNTCQIEGISEQQKLRLNEFRDAFEKSKFFELPSSSVCL